MPIVKPRTAIMRGEVGLLKSDVSDAQIEFLRERLTLTTKPWKGEDPQTILCYREEDGYIWMPRHFAQGHLWRLVEQWDWTEGDSFLFRPQVSLDPERGQVESVPAMVDHIKVNKSGVLISPTGTGKTVMACHIAAEFSRFVGWFCYAGHMVDNAAAHAKSVLGLSEDQIGFVKEGNCDLGRPFTILMIQSLLSRKYPDELYQQIGFMVADEVHRYGAAQWRKVVAQFPAKYRLGMSADPNRKDGLGPLVDWTFGAVGHEAQRVRNEDVKPPSVIALRWWKTYGTKQYCTWKKNRAGEWTEGDPHPTKYDKVLAKDNERSNMISEEIANAAVKGRSILIFSRLVAHLKLLKKLTDIELESRGKIPSTGLLIGDKGTAKKKKAAREAAVKAQVIFTTFAMARDALNIPKLDTTFFATPPGNALQPIGRLREKSEGIDRKPLMVIDCYENNTYSRRKFDRRQQQYAELGIEVQVIFRGQA